MTDEQRPEDQNIRGQHVDKINVDGQILSADEILARARQRAQQKQVQPQSQRIHARDIPRQSVSDIAAIQAQNQQSRQRIIAKKPNLNKIQTPDPFAAEIETIAANQTPKRKK